MDPTRTAHRIGAKPPPVTLFLVRHGETPQHAENRYVGRTDVPLTQRGGEQAVTLAQWAKQAGLTAIVSSPLQRARETAEPSARATGLELQIDERWMELSFGQADGLTAAEMRERFPAARAAFEVDPIAHPLPGGEDPLAALRRAREALTEVSAGQHRGRVLVVAHSTLLRIVLCDLLGIALSRYRDVFPGMANTSGAVIRYREGRVVQELLAYNPVLAPGDG